MASAEVDDWYALLTARAGDVQRSREISVRLAALDDPEILSGVASRMISEHTRFHWYIGPVCDRLPAASLWRLAGEAVRVRRRQPSWPASTGAGQIILGGVQAEALDDLLFPGVFLVHPAPLLPPITVISGFT